MVTGSGKEANKLGTRGANLLIRDGVMELAEGWRHAVEEWNKKL
jgi:hypothetical protein